MTDLPAESDPKLPGTPADANAAPDQPEAMPGREIVLQRAPEPGDAPEDATQFRGRWTMPEKPASDRISLAAVAAVALLVGALGGSLTTWTLSHLGTDSGVSVATDTTDLKQTIARLETDLAALKTSGEQAAKATAAYIARSGERIGKVEKSHAEMSDRLAKLGDAQDKLRVAAATPAPAPAAAPAPDVTGSIAPPPKPEVKKPNIVEGWSLNRVARGGAIVEGRDGLYEVYPGDPLPGLGTVEAVKYVDGRWAVITRKGLIVRN